MNITFQKDIIVIEDALTSEFCDEISAWVVSTNEQCAALYDNKILLNKFENVWYTILEKIILDTWFFVNGQGSSDIYKYTSEDIRKIQEYLKTEWKDLFILNYDPESAKGLENNVHSDFAHFTFSCGLVDPVEYEGGELEFPRHDFKIKLKKGEMAIFPGGLTHPHRITQLISGRRVQFIGHTLTPSQDRKLGQDR